MTALTQALVAHPNGTYTVHKLPSRTEGGRLEVLQQLVGSGYIERLPQSLLNMVKGLTPQSEVYVNEEGRVNGMPLNFHFSELFSYGVYGPVVVVDAATTQTLVNFIRFFYLPAKTKRTKKNK